MKYQKQLDKLARGGFSREELVKLKANAERLLSKGDNEAQFVLDAINISVPPDDYILFMGFCPNGEFANRQDIEWKEKGICTFDYIESEAQANRFNDIFPGDLVVLKKIKEYGISMDLYGHGRVKSIALNENGNRYFVMDWSLTDEVINVPLMACNSTVNVRAMDSVVKEMPDEFFAWIEK